MHPADIAASLKKKGKTQKAIAKELGLSHVTVAAIIQGRSHSYKVANYISAIIGFPLDVIWPNSYRYPPRANNGAGRVPVESN